MTKQRKWIILGSITVVALFVLGRLFIGATGRTATTQEVSVKESADKNHEQATPLTRDQEADFDLAKVMLLRAVETKKLGLDDPKLDAAFRDMLSTASARLEKLHDQRRDHAPIHELRGAAYELGGQNQKAIEAYATYIQRSTASGAAPGPEIREIQTRAMLLKYAPTSLTMKSSHDVERTLQVAEKLESNGCLDEAIGRYLEVIRAYPGHLAARIRLGVCLEAKGEKNGALEHLRFVANAKQAPEALVLEACERVERLSTPLLSKSQQQELVKAKACLDIAADLLKPAYLPPDEFDVKDQASKHQRMRSEVARLTGAATSILTKLLREEPLHFRLYAYQGKAALLSLEASYHTGDMRLVAIEAALALEIYLSWYRTGLGLPETSKTNELSRRREEALYRFNGLAVVPQLGHTHTIELTNGTVTTANCLWERSPNMVGRNAKILRVTLPARKSYLVELDSPGFRGTLELRNSQDSKVPVTLAKSDVGTSQAKSSIRVVTLIDAATCDIVVASSDETAQGYFVLRIHEEKGELPEPVQVVLKSEVSQVEVKKPALFQAEGRFGGGDAKAYHKVYAVKMSAGTSYVIEAKSKSFKPSLIVENTEGKRFAEDHAKEQDAKIDFAATTSETHLIIVTGQGVSATGGFVFSVREK